MKSINMMKSMDCIDKKKLGKLVLILFFFGMLIAVVGAFMPKSASEIRQGKIDKQFFFDGSHRTLKFAVRKKLVVPDSFEHVVTNHQTSGDIIIVKMDYTLLNPFGVRVKHRALGAFTIDGEIKNIKYGWE